MADDSNKKKTVSPLLIVLILILAVMVWRLVHDRWLVVKQHEAAWDRINKLQEEMNAKPGMAATGPEQVREAIGRKPKTDEVVPVEHYFREDYVWRRGLPWMHYYICVIYRKRGDEPILHVACLNCEPQEEELPSKPLDYEALLEKSKENRAADAVRMEDQPRLLMVEQTDDDETTEEETDEEEPTEEETDEEETSEEEETEEETSDAEDTETGPAQ